MKPYHISYNADLSLQGQNKVISQVTKQVEQAKSAGYDTDFASIRVPFDQDYYSKTLSLVAQQKALNPRMLVVIGIGGSNLGALAVHGALNGRWYNDQDPQISVYFADTVDTAMLMALIERIKAVLEQKREVLLVVISKSGTTTETIVNFYLLLEILKQYRPDTYKDYVVAITDEASALFNLAQQNKYACLSVPTKVGGRYSVFSAVGIFPLALLDIDTVQLLEGARTAVNDCIAADNNDAATIALLLYQYYQRNYMIHDHFIFFTDGESIGRWYRQLMGESIGKEYNLQGKQVRVGITPTVSIGSTDLHSVGQLYLGGPQYTFTSFLTREYGQTLRVPEQASVLIGSPVTSVNEVYVAIEQGVQQAYKNSNKPFCHLRLSAVNEFTLGYLLQMYMIQMMYLGYLLDVNPFDQPQVELYKKETKRILHE